MLTRMYGVEMEVPQGKLPGFYAQMIHKIGDEVSVFDRDRQLFILRDEAERETLLTVLDKYQATGELFELWLLPLDAKGSRLTDYGFISADERTYLYDHLVAFFRMDTSVGTAQDQMLALEQMKQHFLTVIQEESGKWYVIDSNHQELLDEIAKKFHVVLEWVVK